MEESAAYLPLFYLVVNSHHNLIFSVSFRLDLIRYVLNLANSCKQNIYIS